MLNAEAEAPKIRQSKINRDELNADVSADASDPDESIQSISMADPKKYLYDANAIAEWKKDCLTNNAVEAAHDSDFMTTLRKRMKRSVDEALDYK
jgi:hypothetical protein